jgi:hypothetical protein
VDLVREHDEHDRDVNRRAALEAAYESLSLDTPVPEVIRRAREYFAFLVQPPAAKLVATFTIRNAAGQVVSANTANPANGAAMADTMQDIDTADLSFVVEDQDNQVLGDALQYSFDDGGAVVTPTVSADTHSCHFVPVAPGVCNISVSDPESPGLAPYTNSLTVTTSAAGSLVGTFTVNPGANTPPPAGP